MKSECNRVLGLLAENTHVNMPEIDKLCLSPDVVFRPWIGGRMVVFPRKSSDLRSPVALDNPTAVTIVQAIRDCGEGGLDAVLREIRSQWDDASEDNVFSFISELVSLGIVSGMPPNELSVSPSSYQDQVEYALQTAVAPCHLTVELTRRCNFSCPFCYTRITSPSTAEPTVSDYLEILDEALDLGVLQFTLTGGEILLRPRVLVEVVRFLANKGARITLFTNGSLLERNNEVLDVLAMFEPAIEITVYGGTSETYRRITGEEFTPVLRGIDALLTRGLKPAIKTTVSRANLRDVDAIAEFARSRSLEYRFDCFLVSRPDGKATDIDKHRLTASEICTLERKFPDRLSYLSDQEDELIRPDFDSGGLIDLPLFHCKAGITSGFLGADFRYSLCCLIRAEKYTYDLKVGNLQDAFTDFTERIRSLSAQRKPECMDCSIFNLCRYGGCPARILNSETEDVEYFCEVAKCRARSFFGVDRQVGGDASAPFSVASPGTDNE